MGIQHAGGKALRRALLRALLFNATLFGAVPGIIAGVVWGVSWGIFVGLVLAVLQFGLDAYLITRSHRRAAQTEAALFAQYPEAELAFAAPTTWRQGGKKQTGTLAVGPCGIIQVAWQPEGTPITSLVLKREQIRRVAAEGGSHLVISTVDGEERSYTVHAPRELVQYAYGNGLVAGRKTGRAQPPYPPGAPQ